MNTELAACTPIVVDPAGFNPGCVLPYSLQVAHIQSAMGDFT
jgi:hypothetical protein